MLVRTPHLAIQFKDTILPLVFATPIMILMMENAALNATRQFLEPGESAVGTKVDVSHMAATPGKHRVRAEAEMAGVMGHQIQFRAAAGMRQGRSDLGRTSAGWSTWSDSKKVSSTSGPPHHEACARLSGSEADRL
ncbi:thioesterase family protein [Methylobacterium sp. P5_C11]